MFCPTAPVSVAVQLPSLEGQHVLIISHVIGRFPICSERARSSKALTRPGLQLQSKESCATAATTKDEEAASGLAPTWEVPFVPAGERSRLSEMESLLSPFTHSLQYSTDCSIVCHTLSALLLCPPGCDVCATFCRDRMRPRPAPAPGSARLVAKDICAQIVEAVLGGSLS